MVGFYICSGCHEVTPVAEAHMEQWNATDKSFAAVCSACHYHMESLGQKYLAPYSQARRIACK